MPITLPDDTRENSTGSTVAQLKAAYLQLEPTFGSELRFKLDQNQIAYNISQQFEQFEQSVNGESRFNIAARVEGVRTEEDGAGLPSSETQFFYISSDEVGDIWIRDETILLVSPVLPDTNDSDIGQKPLPAKQIGTDQDSPFGRAAYEDPSIMIDENGFVLMTRIIAQQLPYVVGKPGEFRATFYQEFWVGHSIHELEFIANGRVGQKGTRVVTLGSGRYGVFNRPMASVSPEFGPGRICYTEFTAGGLEDFKRKLSAAILSTDTMIPGLCAPDEWVGPNQAWALPGAELADFRIGVIGHIARWVDRATGEREYCAMSFVYNPQDNTIEHEQLIATAESFPGVVKRADRRDLDNVIYPGGGEYLDSGLFRLYCGISDNKAGIVDIPDPFLLHG